MSSKQPSLLIFIEIIFKYAPVPLNQPKQRLTFFKVSDTNVHGQQIVELCRKFACRQ